jgi:transposase
MSPGWMLRWPLAAWPAPPARAWDDLRLVGLKLVFLTVTRAVSLLGLSGREGWWKDAEILMLRHQLAVAQRERPRAHSRLTWLDRAWLALLAGTVPAERLAAMRLIVTPGTILRWHRDIVRRRWARLSRQRRSGRPAAHRKVWSVVLRLARENESCGYRRIHAELAGLGITVAPSTVWQILKDAGINRAPRRDGPGWAEFLRSQAQGILALDFYTVSVDADVSVRVFRPASARHPRPALLWIHGGGMVLGAARRTVASAAGSPISSTSSSPRWSTGSHLSTRFRHHWRTATPRCAGSSASPTSTPHASPSSAPAPAPAPAPVWPPELARLARAMDAL